MDNAPVPGATAKVVFPIATGAATAAAISIPVSALVQRGELSGVYVLQDNHLSLRQLRLAGSRGDRIEVLAGMARGEQIAPAPVSALQALMAQRPHPGRI